MQQGRKYNHVLITGASSGIGAALALRYATTAPGINLALSGRNAVRLREVANQCKKAGAIVSEHIADVTDQNHMHNWITALDESLAIDLVIANAGISGGTGGAGESTKQAREIFNANLYGVLNTIDPLIPRMARRGSGHIALMSSLASFSAWPGAPAYSASKAAVRFYGEALHGSLAKQGIRVSVICPGFIDTPMTAVNNYAMPFMITSEKSAKIIAKGLERNKSRIAFPLPTYLMAGSLALIHHNITTHISRLLPEKPSNGTQDCM